MTENILSNLDAYIKKNSNRKKFDCIKEFFDGYIKANKSDLNRLKTTCNNFIAKITEETPVDRVYEMLALVIVCVREKKLQIHSLLDNETMEKAIKHLERPVKFYRKDSQLEYLISCLSTQVILLAKIKNKGAVFFNENKENILRKSILLASAYYCKQDYDVAMKNFIGIVQNAARIKATNKRLYLRLNILCAIYLASIAEKKGNMNGISEYMSNAPDFLKLIPTKSLNAEIEFFMAMSPRCLLDESQWAGFRRQCKDELRRLIPRRDSDEDSDGDSDPLGIYSKREFDSIRLDSSAFWEPIKLKKILI